MHASNLVSFISTLISFLHIFADDQFPDSHLSDKLDRLPIHYALSNGADPAVVSVLMMYGPTAVRSNDHRGWTPVHVAVNLGASEEVVKTLLDAYPEVVLAKTNKGHSIRNVISRSAPNRRKLKELVYETNETVNESVHLPTLRKKSLDPDHMSIS